MRKRWPQFLPLIATLALMLLAGCGGGSDAPPQPPPEPVAWSKTFALGEGRSVVETPTGVLAGYVVVGTVNDAALATKGRDAYVLATDTKGALLSHKAMGDTGNDTGRVVRRTQDGGYVMLGEFMMGSNRQLWVVKMDARGNDEWSRFYGYSTHQESESAADIVEIPGVGYQLAGTTSVTTLGFSWEDVFLVRTLLNGDVLWVDRKGYNDSFEGAAAVQVTSDGGVVFVGRTSQFDANYDTWLVKVDGNGKTVWHRHFSTSGFDLPASVRVTADGGFIIAGTTWSNWRDRQIYLLKTDAQGIQQWSRTLRGTGSYCAAMELTRDGGFILAGETTSRGAGGSDGYLVKTDAQGNVLWENTFGSTGDDQFFAVQATSDGGYVMTGSTAREGETYVYLVKTDANGSSLP